MSKKNKSSILKGRDVRRAWEHMEGGLRLLAPGITLAQMDACKRIFHRAVRDIETTITSTALTATIGERNSDKRGGKRR